MDGVTLVDEALQCRPGLKILLTSGYPDSRLPVDGAAPNAPRLLSKPYRKSELARAVREILDQD
jgi:FixJ family two-component response regulator